MKPIEPAELSAYLDHELEPSRHREIESALEQDAALRAEFEALASLDATWRHAAAGARFSPGVRLPLRRRYLGLPYALALLVFGIAAIRFVPQLSEAMILGFLVHGVVLALVGGWLVRISEGDRRPDLGPRRL
jgi:anti-sigma factor RsiW